MLDFSSSWLQTALAGGLFEAVNKQLKSKAVTVKTRRLVDAIIIASANEEDGDARWVKHNGKPAVYGFKAHVGVDGINPPYLTRQR